MITFPSIVLVVMRWSARAYLLAPGKRLMSAVAARAVRWRWPGVLGFFLVCQIAPPAFAADDFLSPEQAFRIEARMMAPDRAVVKVHVAPGYYVYREPFRFAASSVVLGVPIIPPGKVKFDENFQKNVETYRAIVQIILPVVSASGPFVLSVSLQGCADAGLCYPPMTTDLRLDPAVVSALPGPTATAPPSAFKSWFDDASVDRILAGGRFWQVVLAFFGMGLLLAFTPCVLPMLPILSSLIVGTHGSTSRLRGLLLAAAYGLGMALVYTSLGVAAGLAGEGFAIFAVAGAVVAFDVRCLRVAAASSLGYALVQPLQPHARWATAGRVLDGRHFCADPEPLRHGAVGRGTAVYQPEWRCRAGRRSALLDGQRHERALAAARGLGRPLGA